MKRLFAIALTATAGLLMAQVAAAQSCTGFSGTIQGASGSTSGNSCQAAGQTLAQACGNTETMNGAGQAIFQVNVGCDQQLHHQCQLESLSILGLAL